MTPVISIPNEVRTLKATEALLERIYDAALVGLKGDALALAAGMLPSEYRILCQHDANAEMMALKGKADSELEHAKLLADASRNGDAKASLAILQHVHGWTARQEVSIDVTQRISVLAAIEEARGRVIEHG